MAKSEAAKKRPAAADPDPKPKVAKVAKSGEKPRPARADPEPKPEVATKSGIKAESKQFTLFRISWKIQKGRSDIVQFRWLAPKTGAFFQVSPSQAGSDHKCWTVALQLAEALESNSLTAEQLWDERARIVG